VAGNISLDSVSIDPEGELKIQDFIFLSIKATQSGVASALGTDGLVGLGPIKSETHVQDMLVMRLF
jgi:hypothetical protein